MTQIRLTLNELNQARAHFNRLNNGQKIHNDEEAARFIRERGFVLLMPIDGVPLPNLSQADDAIPWLGFACTDRAWQWKELLPQKKLCAYTKLISKRGTFIDWGIYSAFLRIYGPEGDPDYEYENGRLTRVERDLYRIVEETGAIDSRVLWKKAKPIFNSKRHLFTSALEELQQRFYLTVAGGSLEGWTLHTWDLIERQVPAEVLQTIPQPEEAEEKILQQTIGNSVAISERKLQSILHWPIVKLQHRIHLMKQTGLIQDVQIEGELKSWLTLAKSKEALIN